MAEQEGGQLEAAKVVVPVVLDMSEAEQQIGQLEQRIASLSGGEHSDLRQHLPRRAEPDPRGDSGVDLRTADTRAGGLVASERLGTQGDSRELINEMRNLAEAVSELRGAVETLADIMEEHVA